MVIVQDKEVIISVTSGNGNYGIKLDLKNITWGDIIRLVKGKLRWK